MMMRLNLICACVVQLISFTRFVVPNQLNVQMYSVYISCTHMRMYVYMCIEMCVSMVIFRFIVTCSSSVDVISDVTYRSPDVKI
jgi:hypothetical protein